MSQLKPDQARAFHEDLALASLYARHACGWHRRGRQPLCAGVSGGVHGATAAFLPSRPRHRTRARGQLPPHRRRVQSAHVRGQHELALWARLLRVGLGVHGVGRTAKNARSWRNNCSTSSATH
jgi:hypothetical protein